MMNSTETGKRYAPLILTLGLDEKSQDFFDHLRERYFPPKRNFLQAHLTLFHHLPGRERRTIENALAATAVQRVPLSMKATSVKMMGRGVAYQLDSKQLKDIHEKFSLEWKNWLTPQDQQKLWPHVTVQNKVDTAKAKALYNKLSDSFEPFEVKGTGFRLWAYQNGPWEWLADFDFAT